MKEFAVVAALFMWFLFTLILMFSFIGIPLLLHDDQDRRSTWMTIGFNLSQKLTQ